MAEYVAIWWTPQLYKDYEEFNSFDEAWTAITEWRTRYPWNTYKIAKVTTVILATQDYPAPQMTVKGL